MELLGDGVWRHALVLFTGGWWLGGRCVEEYIESEGEPLRWLLEKCGYRYHVEHGGVKRDIPWVTELMEKTEDIVTRNGGHFEPSDLKEDRSARDTGRFKSLSGGFCNEGGMQVSVSGETPSETGSLSSRSSFDLSVNSSSEEEEEEMDEDSEACMDMMKMMEIQSGEEELNKPHLDYYVNDELYLGSGCEKCQHVQQSYGNEMIIPEKLSRGRLQAQLEGEGTYECALTGLIFEAAERVLVGYSILSWSKFNKFIQDPWRIAGPIFNVQTVNKDPSSLKYIQLPHSLCLAGQGNEKAFGVLHVTGKDPLIERVQSSGSHLRWQVSSLCPVGAISLDTQNEHHGMVLMYKDLGSSVDTHTFRIYLALNCSSWHEDIKKELESEKGHFCRVYKNPNCLLVEGKYQLISKPREEIHPENLPFTVKPTEFKGYFDATFKQPLPFTFNVKVRGTDDTTWSAIIQQGDLENKPSLLQLLLGWFLGSRTSNACETIVSRQEQQSLHPESEPNTEPDSHHAQSDVSSVTALKPSLSGGMQIAGASAQINQTTDVLAVEERQIAQRAGASAVKEHQINQTKDNFVKKNWGDLIRCVTAVMAIADDLFQKGILTDETYQDIWNAKPRQDQMRLLLHTVNLKGPAAILAFKEALQQHDSFVFNEKFSCS